MDWLDYREKLGIGFNDEEKTQHFYIKIFNVLNGIISCGSMSMTFNEYLRFCNDTGSKMNSKLLSDYDGNDRFRDSINIIKEHINLFSDFLSYYIGFVNSLENDQWREWSKKDFFNLLSKCLDESHIQYEVLEDNDGCFVFPKGAKELDDALVSEPLEWLKDYPNARKTYVVALKQYAQGAYVRDVADNFRKALEDFLREFFGNNKDFNENKKEVDSYLKKVSADANLVSILGSLITHYYILNNETAKHKGNIDKTYLEFLMYQTGIFIRTLIVVKKEKEKSDE